MRKKCKEWHILFFNLKKFFTIFKVVLFVLLLSCLTLYSPMNCITPGFPVLHYLPKFAPTHTISSSAALFSSCPGSFSASGSFPMSWLFASSGQSIGASASASVLPVNIQGWFPLGLTGLISKGLSKVFSSTKIRKHQFFGTQPSLLSSSHIHMSPLEKPKLWL